MVWDNEMKGFGLWFGGEAMGQIVKLRTKGKPSDYRKPTIAGVGELPAMEVRPGRRGEVRAPARRGADPTPKGRRRTPSATTWVPWKCRGALPGTAHQRPSPNAKQCRISAGAEF